VSSSAPQHTILLVDDDDQLRASFAALLETQGYAVVHAANGRSALSYCIDHAAPSAMVLDLDMPDMTGWELLAVVRCYRRLADIPVLIVSASPIAEAARAVYPYLRKPADPATFLATLSSLLSIARPDFGS
jgi:CheY-like chemotaxis protein